MISVLRWAHVLALCVFVGSIPAHIVVGILADQADGLAAFAVYHHAKLVLTKGLTAAGLAAVVISGLLLWAKRRPLLPTRWFRLKLVLTALVVVNGGLILTPLAAEMATMAAAAAQSGSLSADLAALRARETLAGALNLSVILAIIYLGVTRPRLGAAA